MKKFIPFILAALPLASHAESGAGPYIGAALGYVAAVDNGTEYNGGDPDSYTQKTSPTGSSIAILGGYNWKLNNQLVVGLEADYEFRKGSDRSYQKNSGITDTDYPVKTQLSGAASLRGRIGYAATENATVYFTAGYAIAQEKRTYQSLNSGKTLSESGWQNGWTAGLGMDYAFTKNVSARVEYRHADYGNRQVNVNYLWVDTLEKQHLTEQSLRVGAVYSF